MGKKSKKTKSNQCYIHKDKKTQKSNTKVCSSIINNNACIYTNSTRSIDGIKQDKRTCIYYDKSTKQCKNERCSKVVCTTARNCSGYKPQGKNNCK